MSRRQRIGNLDRAGQRVFESRARTSDQTRQRLTRHVLHRDEVHPLVLTDVVDGDDVRMIQARSGPCFLDEALAAFVIQGSLPAQHFHCYGPTQARIDCSIDHAHPAFAERLEKLVVREHLRGHDRPRHSSLSATRLPPHPCPR
jgi:hypothetical protein